MDKLNIALRYVFDRLGEASTWQGIGFIAVLCGARWAADLDWGAAAALGGMVSGIIKAAFPDKFKTEAA